ncbi:MAG: hypothetical protein GKS05_01410 [Nitrospirales bacterium]|nr:hypothetical protein [Nitrospirales bacterium]
MVSATRETRVWWFSLGVTLCLIVLCNGVLLGGVVVSGVNLEHILAPPEFFDAAKDQCVRVAWTHVVGVEGPMRVCSEWLVLSDLTGQTHVIRDGEPLVLGNDGKLYYASDRNRDFRLAGLLLFVVVVIFSGVRLKRFLIVRYRVRLDG